jgi:predicted GNAT family acetyltransferase
MEDIDSLFPLQAGYEIEEVLPKGAQFNPALCRKGLEQLVKGGMILAAEMDGRLVGKININAVSFTRLQIGGVFVDPAYRGQGIAKMMTSEIIKLLLPLGKNFSLFVKKINTAAVKAYTKTGFTKFADYRINYYA